MPAASLRELVDRLETLAGRRSATRPASDTARTRASRLRDHLAGHLRVRARSLDAPVVVLLLGPTGAGKSTLFNTIAGRAASPTGVLRPTTRSAIVLANPDDAPAVRDGTLAGIEPHRLRFITDEGIAEGLALVDAPDVDSVEHANRELADRLVEAADLCVFVTTATRYADRVPWLVLGRVRERGLPLIVVVNRLPPEADDRRVVLADVGRLFAEAGLSGGSEGADDQGGALEVIGVNEGRDRSGRRSAPARRGRGGDGPDRASPVEPRGAGRAGGAGPGGISGGSRAARRSDRRRCRPRGDRRGRTSPGRGHAVRPRPGGGPRGAGARHVPPRRGPPPLAGLRRRG